MPKDPAATTIRPATTRRRTGEFELPSGDDWFTPAIDHPEFLRVLWYGREGSIKTTSAATMANTSEAKILVLNAEGGLKVKPLQRRGITVDNIQIYPDPDTSAGHKFVRAELDAIFRRVKADLESKDPSRVWAGTIWDSATELVANVLDEVSDVRVRKLITKLGDPEKVDPFFVDRADYGTMSKMIRDLLRKYLDLPCHWGGTALLRREVEKDTKRPIYGPAVNPGLWTNLLGDPDIVLACVGEDELGPPRALTRGNTRFRAKDRFSCLPRILAVPTFERILGYYDEVLNEDDDPLQKELTPAACKIFDGPKKVIEPDDDTDEDTEDEDDD
jgi:hypothetical protein